MNQHFKRRSHTRAYVRSRPYAFVVGLLVLVLDGAFLYLNPHELAHLFIYAAPPILLITFFTTSWIGALLIAVMVGVELWFSSGGVEPIRLAIEVLSLGILVNGAGRARSLYLESTRLRELVEHATHGILLIDLRTLQIVEANQAICTLLGHSRASLIGMSPAQVLIFPDETYPDLRQYLRQPDDTPGPYKEWTLRTQNGEAISVGVTKRPHLLHDMDAVTLNIQDLQPRRALQARLVADERDRVRSSMEAGLLRANRLAQVGTLTAGVAHEINNPLAFIESNLDFSLGMLRGDRPFSVADRTNVVEALQDAIMGGQRIGNVTKQLKVFAHDEKQVDRAVHLQAVCEVSARMVKHRFPPDTTLHLNFEPVPPVFADDSRLGQVVTNLLINATHATEQVDRKGVITMHISQNSAGDVVLDVIDNGSGIPDDALNEVFDPFFTTKVAGEGTGLGLSVSQGIIQGSNGVLSVHHTSEMGTTMRVVLPQSTEGSDIDAYSATPPTASTRDNVHLLLVDDEAALRRALARSLGRSYRVTVCDGPLSALDAIQKKEHYDAVLCDVIMPVMTGEELQRAVAAFDPALADRFVFMTGGAFTQETNAFANRLGEKLLNKPFGPTDVGVALAYLLEKDAPSTS